MFHSCLPALCVPEPEPSPLKQHIRATSHPTTTQRKGRQRLERCSTPFLPACCKCAPEPPADHAKKGTQRLEGRGQGRCSSHAQEVCPGNTHTAAATATHHTWTARIRRPRHSQKRMPARMHTSNDQRTHGAPTARIPCTHPQTSSNDQPTHSAPAARIHSGAFTAHAPTSTDSAAVSATASGSAACAVAADGSAAHAVPPAPSVASSPSPPPCCVCAAHAPLPGPCSLAGAAAAAPTRPSCQAATSSSMRAWRGLTGSTAIACGRQHVRACTGCCCCCCY